MTGVGVKRRRQARSWQIGRNLGATGIGYALLLGLVGVVSIGAVATVGTGVEDVMEGVFEDEEGGGDDLADDGGGDEDGALRLSFDPRQGLPGTLVQSATIRLGAIAANTPLAITSTDSEAFIVIDETPIAGTATAVSRGDEVALRLRAGATLGDVTTVSLDFGGESVSWSVTADVPVSFAPLDNAPALEAVTSTTERAVGLVDPVTVAVDSDASSDVTLFSVDGGAFTAGPAPLGADQTVQLQTFAGPADGTVHDAVVTFDGVPTTWQVTSIDSAVDLTIDDITPVAPSTRVSTGPIALDSFTVPLAIEIETVDGLGDPAYVLNGGADPGSNPGEGTAEPNATLEIFVTSADRDAAARRVLLTLGGTEIGFNVITGDSEPDPLTPVAVTDARGETLVTSDPITPSGVNVPVSLSVSDASGTAAFEVNGSGEFVTSAEVQPTDTLVFQVMAGLEDGVARVVDLDFNGVLSTWEVTAPDVTPEPFSFEITEGHTAGEDATSNSVIVQGITAPTLVEAGAGGMVSIDGGDFAESGYANPGSVVFAQQPIPAGATLGQEYTLTITMGAEDGRTPVTGDWVARAGGNDKEPGSFSIPDTTGAEPNRAVPSSEIRLEGFDAEADLVLTGDGSPMVSIDNRPFVSAGPADGVKIRPNQPFRLQMITAADLAGGADTTRTITVQVGDSNTSRFTTATWTTVNGATDSNPDTNFMFALAPSPLEFQETYTPSALVPAGYSETIDFRITGPDADLVEARVRSEAFAPPGAGGLVGQINPGDSIAMRMTVDIADGDPKELTIQVGDATYEWVQPTWDQYPDPLPSFPDQLWAPNSVRYLLQAPGTQGQPLFTFTITGIDPAAPSAPTVGSQQFWDHATEQRLSKIDNDTEVRVRGFGPGIAGTSLVAEWNVGGRTQSATLTAANDPRLPVGTPLADLAGVARNQEVCSAFVQPGGYGATMQATITGGPASAVLETDDGQRGQTIIFDVVTRTSYRACVNPGNADSATVTFDFVDPPDGLTSGVLVSQDWTVHTVPASALDRVPDAFSLFGDGVTSFNGGPNSSLRWWIHDDATDRRLILGYEGEIDMAIEQISGPVDGMNFSLQLSDCEDCGPNGARQQVSISPGMGIRLSGGGGRSSRTYGFRITAGDLDDPGQQFVYEFTVRLNDIDAAPDPASFVFPAGPTNAAPNVVVQSAQIRPTGYENTVDISVSGEGDPFLLVDGVNRGTAATLHPTSANRDEVAVGLTSGPPDGSTRTATVTLDGRDETGNDVQLTAEFSVRTADSTPDDITFTAATGAEPGNFISSNTQTVTGLDADLPVNVSVSGDGNPAMYIDSGSGESFFSGTAQVENGDMIRLEMQPQGFNATNTAILVFGPVDNPSRTESWDVTTRAANVNAQFSFTDVSALPGSPVSTGPITPTGYLDPATVTVVDGADGTAQISLNNGALVPVANLTGAETLSPGESFEVQLTAGSSGTPRSVTVTIGDTTRTWTVTAQ